MILIDKITVEISGKLSIPETRITRVLKHRQKISRVRFTNTVVMNMCNILQLTFRNNGILLDTSFKNNRSCNIITKLF